MTSEEEEVCRREMTHLNFIMGQNPPKIVRNSIVKLFRTIEVDSYICNLYEFLGPTLDDVLSSKKFKGFTLEEVRQISHQICVATNYIHALDLVHHDIKPSNIAFVLPNYVSGKRLSVNVKLIDFGSSIHVNYRGGHVATTMRYRAPEVGLRGQSTFGADVWSLACTMFEMYQGTPLFDCHTEEDKCYMIEFMFEEEIPYMLGYNSGFDCFDDNGRLKNVADYIKSKEWSYGLKRFMEYNGHTDLEDAKYFFDLLQKMLCLRNYRRIDTYDVLSHKFFENLRGVYKPMVPATSRNLGIVVPRQTRSFELKDGILPLLRNRSVIKEIPVIDLTAA